MSDVPLEKMLKRFGIVGPGAQDSAIEALKSAGIISRKPGRKNMASSKAEEALRALEDAFVWRCNGNECRAEALKSDLEALVVQKANCQICGGSADKRALKRMSEALAVAGVNKILVVGGTDKKRLELESKSPPGVEWRLVDGTKSQNDRQARPYLEWAEIIVIWASTELNHKVSAHYAPNGDPRVITVRARGIASLAKEVIQHVRGA